MAEQNHFPSTGESHIIPLQTYWEDELHKTEPIPEGMVKDCTIHLGRSEIHNFRGEGEFWVNRHDLTPFVCTYQSVRAIMNENDDVIWDGTETKEE